MGEVKEYTFEELCRIVGAIAAAYGMRRVYLFGSRARGDNKADSDYDFFVVPDDDCGMFRLAGFFGKLQEVLGDVDVVEGAQADKLRFAAAVADFPLLHEIVLKLHLHIFFGGNGKEHHIAIQGFLYLGVGQGEKSAIAEAEESLGIKVISIVSFNDLLAYIENDPKLKEHLPEMEKYRSLYGV